MFQQTGSLLYEGGPSIDWHTSVILIYAWKRTSDHTSYSFKHVWSLLWRWRQKRFVVACLLFLQRWITTVITATNRNGFVPAFDEGVTSDGFEVFVENPLEHKLPRWQTFLWSSLMFPSMTFKQLWWGTYCCERLIVLICNSSLMTYSGSLFTYIILGKNRAEICEKNTLLIHKISMKIETNTRRRKYSK